MLCSSEVKYVKGVGPKRAEILKKLEIYSIKDLLFYFPRTYQDRRINAEKKEPSFDYVSAFKGTVKDFFEIYTSTSLKIFKIIIDSEGKEIEANLFKRAKRNFDVFAPIKNKIKKGKEIFIVGRADGDFFNPKIGVEEFYFPEDENYKINAERIVPVYSLTSDMDNKTFRGIVYRALDCADYVNEIINPYYIAKRGLLPRVTAVKNIHFPKDLDSLAAARKRLIYEELFLMAMAWAVKKRQTREIKKNRSYEIKRTLLTPFKNNMGFEFTASQKKAINEIFSDMNSPYPMNRLLQGDVGSGKTVVAISACLLAVENGYQCCFMAPTEILAEQHFMTFSRFLSSLNVRFEILSSSTPKKKKEEIISKTANGELDILIGTHSLIESDIKFKNLALAVIDEQHRFGVRQRATLRKKGENVDMLIMTATPIPRTLFLSLYGDLELSVLTDMPPGRKPIKTFKTAEKEAFEKAKDYLKKGGQAYIVFPIIDESSKTEIKSLIAEFERINKEFSDYKTAMIYGRMKPSEKQKIMRDFSDGKIDILCATQVIEVGIDVPNANVMIIQNAERFGLASLHQLRGRIGRGEKDSVCFLISEAKNDEARERIKAMCETTNGFDLSEKDAYIRGVGEVMGVKQHGDMEFKIASIYRDREILNWVFEDRDEILKEDPYMYKKENQALKKELKELYGEKWHIIDLN